MFIDQIRIYAKAGDGGAGCCSFRREKYVPHGGPDGGDGGKGGDIVLYADEHTSSLVSLFYEPFLQSVDGGNGQGNSLTQLSQPRGVIVDEFGQIYVSDRNNDRVMRWCEGAKEGIIVVGGNGQGKQSNQFNGLIGLSFDR